MKHWNLLTAAHAYYEGWSLFDVDGRLRILKVDDPNNWPDDLDPSLVLNEFDSDDEAETWVLRCAIAGSEMHRAALKMRGKLCVSGTVPL